MNPFKGRHFQRDIILWAVRWYCKYGICVHYAKARPQHFIMVIPWAKCAW
uniref:IS6 family transposase n=2 Tax=Enterobacteriaceae TaxID=543 RepID=A0A6J4ELH6_ECOLX|nr:hypothetical protein [Klebsiella pneumoniae]BCG51369.1 hypothetical protein [Escherichia coli]